MSRYGNIPLTIEEHTGDYWHWPRLFTIPKGWEYMTDTDLVYRTAPCDLDFALECAGDWLEMVNPERTHRIRHRIV